ncbi:zf-ZPR1-domain-containing protein [Amylostereum chailletii]|nr:zf-ZPR1-domain-containing protein [Amylostereum chailletii]
MSQPVEQSLFPTIGSVANQTNELSEANNDSSKQTDEDEERAGVTRLLLTSIPYFREVIIMSFRCEHCGFSNNEIQSAGSIRPEGVVYTARVLSRADLDRQIVKSETCTVTIPEFELTIPPSKGQLTNIEGLIRDITRDLSVGQPLRRVQDEVTYNKIEDILDKLRAILADDDDEEDQEESVGAVKSKKAADKDAPMKPFTVRLDDPTGNSFVEFVGSMADPKWNMRTYHRTKEHNIALGLVAPDEQPAPIPADTDPLGGGLEGENEEIYVFPGVCSSCGHSLNTLMKKVVIPYFKDILIMSTNCDLCGYRDNEVKSGAAISEQGRRITLKVEDRDDLSRDILKSESCGIEIPEIDLVLQAGTLGGRFTTLEGILDQVYEELSDKLFAGDSSAQGEGGNAFENFLGKLKAVKNADRPFTLILDDPLANSYLQNLYAPDPDPNMVIEMYDRTWEQNEDLGINDMRVENYDSEGGATSEKAEASPVTQETPPTPADP